jgi:hypothetical protein
MTGIEILFGIGLVLAVYQLWVSLKLFRAPQYEPRQKWLQLALIWLIPAIGAVVVHSMLRSEGHPPYVPEKGYTPPNDSGAS